jgi:hypothetical protein
VNKLGEIKQLFADYQSEDMETRLKSMRIIQTRYYEDILYLLSLIEEKDKALTFYADEATYDVEHLDKHGYIIIDKDNGDIARKALRGE